MALPTARTWQIFLLVALFALSCDLRDRTSREPCEPGSYCESGPCRQMDDGTWLCPESCEVLEFIEIELPERPRLDWLFIFDESPGMAGELPELFAALEMMARPQDFEFAFAPHLRLGVTTMSVGGEYAIEPGQDCLSTRELVDGEPYPDGSLIAAPGNSELIDFDELDPELGFSRFLDNAEVGVCGSSEPQGLLAMKMAIEAHAPSMEPGRYLKALLITGQDDHSPGEIEDYVAWLFELPFHARVTGTLGAPWLGQPPCANEACQDRCETEPASEAPCHCGALEAGERYHEFFSAIEAGSSSAIDGTVCNPGWGWFFHPGEDRTIGLQSDISDPAQVLVIIERSGEIIQCPKPSMMGGCEDGEELSIMEEGLLFCEPEGARCAFQPEDVIRITVYDPSCL